MQIFETDDVNALYPVLLRRAIEMPDYRISPRGKPTRELFCVKITLHDPRRCLITLRERRLNYRFAIAEKFEYLAGVHDPERLGHYSPPWKRNRDEFGAYVPYGPRLRGKLEAAYRLLRRDPDSRRAYCDISAPDDLTNPHENPPCTLGLQFLLRDDRLHLVAVMRSNDLWLGVPYDINSFAFLQEVMASWLGAELGDYTHITPSLHLYEKDLASALRLLENPRMHLRETNPVFGLSCEETHAHLPACFELEEHIREGGITQTDGERLIGLPLVFQTYLARLLPHSPRRA